MVNQIAKRMGKKAIYCLCTLVYGGILTLMFFLAGEGRTTMFIVFMAVAFLLQQHDRDCSYGHDYRYSYLYYVERRQKTPVALL